MLNAAWGSHVVSQRQLLGLPESASLNPSGTGVSSARAWHTVGAREGFVPG